MGSSAGLKSSQVIVPANERQQTGPTGAPADELGQFVAAVLGGIGIIPGAMVGGLVLGIVETIVSAIGFSLWRDAAAFIILILILIFKPSGIFGKNTREKV